MQSSQVHAEPTIQSTCIAPLLAMSPKITRLNEQIELILSGGRAGQIPSLLLAQIVTITQGSSSCAEVANKLLELSMRLQESDTDAITTMTQRVKILAQGLSHYESLLDSVMPNVDKHVKLPTLYAGEQSIRKH